MNSALYITTIVEGIFAYLLDDRHLGTVDEFTRDYLQKRYWLAGICHEWRKIMASRIFDTLYLHIRYDAYNLSPARSDHDAASAGMATGENTADSTGHPFHVQTSPGMTGFAFQPRTLSLRVDEALPLGKELAKVLGQHAFMSHCWPSVQAVKISMAPHPPTGRESQMGEVALWIRMLLSVTPNARALSWHVRNSQQFWFHVDALLRLCKQQFTALDLNFSTRTDYSKLNVPALRDLSVCYFMNSDLPHMGCTDIHMLTSLKISMIRPRVFLQLLELAAVENSVAFPNLESLSVLLDAIGPEDAYIPTASKQIRYNFPKLRSLSLRSDKDSSPDMYWIFKDAPLERLHLATNTSFLEQLDLSHFPKLAHVRLTSRPQFRRVSFFDIQNRLTGPASNIRTLDIDVTLQVMVTSWVFGCAKLRSLKIAHDVSPPVLRSVLKQLPELVTLDIQHYLTHREGNVDLPDMRKAVLESDLSIINNSLQSLFVTDKYIFQLNDPYTANAVKLVELVAHLPSLLKLTIVGSRPRIRGQLIEDTFADSAIQECAHHFANVSVHLHDLLE